MRNELKIFLRVNNFRNCEQSHELILSPRQCRRGVHERLGRETTRQFKHLQGFPYLNFIAKQSWIPEKEKKNVHFSAIKMLSYK